MATELVVINTQVIYQAALWSMANHGGCSRNRSMCKIEQI